MQHDATHANERVHPREKVFRRERTGDPVDEAFLDEGMPRLVALLFHEQDRRREPAHAPERHGQHRIGRRNRGDDDLGRGSSLL